MSYPILYMSNETDFGTLGLGILRDTLSALVTEERNGQFELVMEYPVDGMLFNEIKPDRLLKVDASNNLKAQRFKIIRITKPSSGVITIYAEHISYLSQDLALKPFVAYNGDANQALNMWRDNIIDPHPFTTYSDIQTNSSGKWTIDKVDNARQALGGTAGSMLDSYGGEFRFDNYHIGLYTQRGNDSGALIAYGKNLIDLEQEEEISSTYTSIYPFATVTDGDGNESILTLPEFTVDSEHVGKYARRKILTVDFSQDEITTVEALRNRANQYITSNNVGVPKVSLKVSFLDLSNTLDYKNLEIIEEINLCDQVTIYYEKLGIRQKAKVIKTVWDALLDQYDQLVIGETRASLSNVIDTTVDGKLKPIVNRVNIVQIAANGKNKIFRQIEEPTENMSENDLWYQPVGDGETMLYRYDGAMWSLEKISTGLLGGTLDAENGDVNLINVNVANIVGETSDFVRSNWNNGVGGSVQATGDGVVTNASNGSQALMQNGVFLVRGTDGQSIGYIGYSQDENNNNFTLTTANGRSLQMRYSNGDGTFSPLFEYLSYLDSLYFGKRAVFQSTVEMNGNLNMNQKQITEVQKVRTGVLETGNIGSILNDTDNRIAVKGTSGAKLGVGGQVGGGFTAIFMVDSTRGYMYKPLSMEGNDITNQSDSRLKENIVDADYDGLGLYREVKPRYFEWINKERFGHQTELGFIAQELQALDPELVTQTPDEDVPDGVAWSINETQLNRRTWIAVHQLVKENDSLKQELADLKNVLNEKGLI